MCPAISQNPPHCNLSWLSMSDVCTTRKTLSLGDWPEATGKLSHHYKTQDCKPHHFSIKSLALPAPVSLQTIHFRVLDKSPFSGPGRGTPSCNTLSLLESEDVYARSTCLLVLQMKELGEWAEAIEQVLMPTFYCCGK